MKSILIISGNKYLNVLYTINLEVYLAASVNITLSAEDAIKIMGVKKDFDLILTLGIVNKKDSHAAIESYLIANSLKIPLLIAGGVQDEKIGENTFGVASKFNIQNILKTSAKILGITAKQMAGLDVGAYYPISIIAFSDFIKAPCQVFIENEKNYIALAGPDDPIRDALISLHKKGIKQIYVNSKDRLTIINKISLTLVEKIVESLKKLDGASPDEKALALSDGYQFAAANLFSNEEIKHQMQEIAIASIDVMEDVTKESPSMNSLMATMLHNKDGYVFTHSMIISYVSYYMISNASWGGEGQVEKINFVAFFHDIFLAPIYLKYPDLKMETSLLESNILDAKEKEIVFNHAYLAAELVAGYKRCPMGADALIRQHHGIKSGKGFTDVYSKDLSPISKVFLVAEIFVEEFMDAQNNKIPFDKKAAIEKIDKKFSSASYSKIIQTLSNVPV